MTDEVALHHLDQAIASERRGDQRYTVPGLLSKLREIIDRKSAAVSLRKQLQQTEPAPPKRRQQQR